MTSTKFDTHLHTQYVTNKAEGCTVYRRDNCKCVMFS